FATRIKAEMAQRGWSQSELADRASRFLPKGHKIQRYSINNYVKETALPRDAFLLAIAKALGTTPEDLLPERGLRPKDAAALPTTDVRDTGDGMAFLRLNRRVPWPVAVEILKLVNDADIAEEPQNDG
ncbi:MAG: helix-turn-helix transcriptional regulator, partial [Pseudomonadota bacterium]